MNKENYSEKLLRMFTESKYSGKVPAMALSEILNISLDASYRRLSGKVELTLNEAMKICSSSNLSIFQSNSLCCEKVLFNYIPAFTEAGNLSKEQEVLFFEQLADKIIRENGLVYSLISDTSLVLLLRYPKLMALRLFLSKDHRITPFSFPVFSLDTPLPDYVQNLSKFALLHEKSDSCDFWCRQTFTKMIDEIAYYKSLGVIPPKEEKLLLEESREMLHNFEQYATNEQKEGGGKFTLYITPYNLTNNEHLIFVGETLITFFELDGVNCVWTNNSNYCHQQKSRFEKMKNNSVIISGSNLRERKLFFEKIHRMLDDV